MPTLMGRAPKVLLLTTLLLGALAVEGAAQGGKKIHMALGDIETVETLNLLIALERTKQRGVEVELTAFKSEDIATQAVVNGQADVGVGTPYAVIQNVRAPIRIFYQLATLQFFPVVNKEFYGSWKDLDGQEMVVHSRGSGTEAMARVMAQQHGITYKSISFVPGSEVRALAMLKGNIKATFVDATNKNFLMKEAPGKFLVLPIGEMKASDEALFARQEFLEAEKNSVAILLEELLRVWRSINADPEFVVSERARLRLLPDLPAKLEPEVLPFFQQAVENGIFPNDGGGARAAKTDFEFYTVSGQLKGSLGELKVEDFWYLDPLNAALAKLEG